MAGSRKPNLVSIVQKALENGPVPADELLTTVHQAGLRWIDPGTLWEACATHGLADLRDGLWVPRGWAQAPAVPARHQESIEERAAAEATRLAMSLGLPAHEPLPPVGPMSPEWPEAARKAAAALRHELQAVSKRRVQTDIPLIAVAGATTPGGRLRRFEAQGEIGAAEGMPATLIANNQPFQVEIVSVFGSVVTLSTPSDMPTVTEATLRTDLSWLLTEQSRRLGELVHGGPGFDAVAALAVVTPPEVRGRVRPTTSISVKGLNAGQQAAVQLALTSGVTWLWGPPGTGKTTTVAALIAELCARKQRVLLAAPTNAALDVAIQALLKRQPSLADGALVRIGQPADPALTRRVLADEIAAMRGAPLAQRRVAAGSRLRECRNHLDALKQRELSRAEETARLRLETEIAELQVFVRELDGKLKQVRRQICREATVVAATAHQLSLETLKNLTFDVVVLDEASMTTAALAMLVAGAGSGHTVIAGDFRQLPPVVIADTPEAQDWLRRSPFEKAGIPHAVSERKDPPRLAALTKQYRMRQAIGDVVSTAFYDGRLSTAPGTAARTVRSRASWTKAELVIIDTTAMRSRTARRQGSLSRYNLAHAQLTASLTSTATATAADLGLITPFAPQARLLEALLPADHLEDWAASTVHRFQGGERDIVVYDTVDTGRGVSPLNRWFTEGNAGSEGARLLNVAASRARDHLMVIGALDALHERSAAFRDPVWTFFAHLIDTATPIPWQSAVSTGLTELIEDDDLITRLRDDIKRATTVDMWLPGSSLHAMPLLLAELTTIRADGPESEAVTIWVEPKPDGHLHLEALQARREGINIRPCLPILESSAILGDVVWSASNSLLAAAPGVVLRTEHRAFADAARRAQHRRPGAGAPSSGQHGHDCGRCGRMLIRYEQDRRGRTGLRYECSACGA
ncbi:AAA domain-containing protein [Nonomuraea sp. NPDC003709]|uniref:DEAD/DEAH box helicase n=1 Tax=Nonomuraea sp. NPDC003709 TaxID=3154450 RepID=UPI0033A7653A